MKLNEILLLFLLLLLLCLSVQFNLIINGISGVITFIGIV